MGKLDLAFNLSFLGEEKYKMILYRDDDDTNRIAIDYKKEENTVLANDKLTVKLAHGDGWLSRLITLI
ncbi:glycoside hydrolase family 97 C-terminal domain-containing protein [Ancylomarina sp. YFZ004]